jgi:hypothetical protein
MISRAAFILPQDPGGRQTEKNKSDRAVQSISNPCSNLISGFLDNNDGKPLFAVG